MDASVSVISMLILALFTGVSLGALLIVARTKSA